MESLNPTLYNEDDRNSDMNNTEYIHEFIIASSSFSSRYALKNGENWIMSNCSSSSSRKDEKEDTNLKVKEATPFAKKNIDDIHGNNRIILLDHFLDGSSTAQTITGNTPNPIYAPEKVIIDQNNMEVKKNKLVCIDVDGPFVAIKDVRKSPTKQQNLSSSMQQQKLQEGLFYLSRQTNTICSHNLNHDHHDKNYNSKETSNDDLKLLLSFLWNKNNTEKLSSSSCLEPLPFRQMRILQDQDELLFISQPQNMPCVDENGELEKAPYRVVKFLYQFKSQQMNHQQDSQDKKAKAASASETTGKDNLKYLFLNRPSKQNLHSIDEEEGQTCNKHIKQDDDKDQQKPSNVAENPKKCSNKSNEENIMMDNDTSFFPAYKSAAAIASQDSPMSFKLRNRNNLSNYDKCDKGQSPNETVTSKPSKKKYSATNNIQNVTNNGPKDDDNYYKNPVEGLSFSHGNCLSGEVEINDQGYVSNITGEENYSDETNSNSNKKKTLDPTALQPKRHNTNKTNDIHKKSSPMENVEMHGKSNENKVFLTQPDEEDGKICYNDSDGDNSLKELVDPDETQRYDLILPSQAQKTALNMKDDNEDEGETCSMIPSSESSTTTINNDADHNEKKVRKGNKAVETALLQLNEIPAPSYNNKCNATRDPYDEPTQLYNVPSPLPIHNDTNNNETPPINSNDGSENVVHRVKNGAMMTGPVGTILTTDHRSKKNENIPSTTYDKKIPRMQFPSSQDILISIALLSNENNCFDNNNDEIVDYSNRMKKETQPVRSNCSPFKEVNTMMTKKPETQSEKIIHSSLPRNKATGQNVTSVSKKAKKKQPMISPTRAETKKEEINKIVSRMTIDDNNGTSNCRQIGSSKQPAETGAKNKNSNNLKLNKTQLKFDQKRLHQRLTNNKEKQIEEIEGSESSAPKGVFGEMKQRETNHENINNISDTERFSNLDDIQSQREKNKAPSLNVGKNHSSKNLKTPTTTKQLLNNKIVPSSDENEVEKVFVEKFTSRTQNITASKSIEKSTVSQNPSHMGKDTLEKHLLVSESHSNREICDEKDLRTTDDEQSTGIIGQSTKVKKRAEAFDAVSDNTQPPPQSTEAKPIVEKPQGPSSISVRSNKREENEISKTINVGPSRKSSPSKGKSHFNLEETRESNHINKSIESDQLTKKDSDKESMKMDIPRKYDHSHLCELSQEKMASVSRHEDSIENDSCSKKKLSYTSPEKSVTLKTTETSEKQLLIETPTIVSTRKRQRGINMLNNSKLKMTPESGNNDNISGDVRIIFTGLEVTKKYKMMAASFGAEIVEKIEDAKFATHVIAGSGDEKLRRTPKLMICLCCTENILHLDWLIQSSKAKKALECFPFLLKDEKAESKYNFSLLETVKNGALIRSQEGGGIFSQYNIYFSKGVAGNKAPPSNELDLIVDAAGGTLLKSLTEKATRHLNPSDIIIVTSDPATPNQKKDKNVTKFSKIGAKKVTTSWLFDCFMLQKVNFIEETETLKNDTYIHRKRRRNNKADASTKVISSMATKAGKRRRKK